LLVLARDRLVIDSLANEPSQFVKLVKLMS
jgi:hypothetical protein